MNTVKNKILIALYYYDPYVSGLSVYAKRIAEGLAASGYEVTIITSRHDKTLPKSEIMNGVNVHRIPVLLRLSKGVIMPGFWFDIVRYSRKFDYMNMHLPMAEAGLSSLFISKNKLVTTYHCDLNLGAGILNRTISFIAYFLMRIQLSRSRVVIPSTSDYLSHSRMKKFLPKAHPIYPMVTTQDFTAVDSTSLFKRLGIGKDEIKIGFVGRIVYEKGISYLLGSIPHILKTKKNIRILIAGDYKNVAGGSVKDELNEWLDKYPDTIIFTGFLNDLERNQFYSGLDVFVLPSIDPLEAFGMVQVEAMLCGSPVVASDLPGVREVVGITGYGRISRVRDSKDIAKQIVEVISNPKRYKPARARVAELFDPKITIDEYSELMPK